MKPLDHENERDVRRLALWIHAGFDHQRAAELPFDRLPVDERQRLLACARHLLACNEIRPVIRCGENAAIERCDKCNRVVLCDKYCDYVGANESVYFMCEACANEKAEAMEAEK